MNTQALANYAWRELQDFEPSEALLDPQIVVSPLMLLRSLIPLPQTVKDHLVTGLDLERAVSLTAVPMGPMPFFYLGVVDYETGEMLCPSFCAGGADSKVKIWGKPATMAGKKASGAHIPLGPYLPISSDGRAKIEGKTNFLFGSSTVDMEGHHAVRLGEVGMNCTMIPVPTPTTSVISWPCGPLVLTGGPMAWDAGATLTLALDELVNLFLGELFSGTPRWFEFAKEYLKEVYAICRDASLIAMTEPNEERAVALIQEKMLELFTMAPIKALRGGVLELLKIQLVEEEA